LVLAVGLGYASHLVLDHYSKHRQAPRIGLTAQQVDDEAARMLGAHLITPRITARFTEAQLWQAKEKLHDEYWPH